MNALMMDQLKDSVHCAAQFKIINEQQTVTKQPKSNDTNDTVAEEEEYPNEVMKNLEDLQRFHVMDDNKNEKKKHKEFHRKKEEERDFEKERKKEIKLKIFIIGTKISPKCKKFQICLLYSIQIDDWHIYRTINTAQSFSFASENTKEKQ